MYCRNCGQEINDQAVVCIHCGCSVNGTQPSNASAQTGVAKTGLGVVLALFLGLIGLIIGLCLYPKDSFERKTFMKGWGITFGVCFAISFIFGMINCAAIIAYLA